MELSPELAVSRPDGSAVRISDLIDSPTLLFLLRHLAWIPCQAHLGEVARHLEDFRRLGVAVVAVSMGPPDALARYLASHPTPIPVFADPRRLLYTALGLGRTSWARLLRPRLLWKYLKLVARGGKVRPVPKGEDALQLGGDFVIRPDRRVVWAHRGTDPTDRPSVAELLRAARTAVDAHRGTG